MVRKKLQFIYKFIISKFFQIIYGKIVFLDQNDSDMKLKDLNKDENYYLTKEFSFKNFKESQKFINKVGDIAEKENHHPDITFGWGYCRVKIFTHAIKGLAESDFILAAKIDKI